MFIVLEGIDGGGKTTQIQHLTAYFRRQGREVTCCSDPGTTALGLQIRRLLLDSPEIALAPKAELMLFFAARAQLIDEIIAPALRDNQIVICDRFLLSSVVYQGHLGQIAPATIWDLGRQFFHDCLPDLILVLDLPVEVSRARTQRALDRIESRGADYLNQVRQSFLNEAAQQPESIRVVDATLPPDQVAKQIEEISEQFSAKFVARPGNRDADVALHADSAISHAQKEA